MKKLFIQAVSKFLLGAVLVGLLIFIPAGTLHFASGWLKLPTWVSAVAAALFLLAYLMYVEVLRENAYLSRTIQVQEGQKVIDTGLYGVVRHPMYSATVLLFLSMPMVLGSVIALLPFLFYPFIIAARIRNEETVLEKELPGYAAYKQKVRWRLLPYIW